jgi:aminoglycoside 6-adenylyltransferase
MIAPVTVLNGNVTYDRPFRLLLDKDGSLNAFQFTPQSQGQAPTSTEFLECVHWFYAAVIMWAKYLGRDDLWAAKQRDWDSKALLLTMIEWDHKARNGWDYDTWYLGSHLKKWVDADLLDPIAACWSGFSGRDSARALRASLDLFDKLSARTATALSTAPFDSAGVRLRIEHLLPAVN